MASPYSILFVDRATIIREPLAAAVAAEGYLTLAAGDGEEAFEIATMCPTSLLVLDLELPGVHGVELLKRLRAHPAHTKTPVILLFQGTDLKAVQDAVELGVKDYLIKTKFSLSALLEMIARYCPPVKAEATPNTLATPKPEASTPRPAARSASPVRPKPRAVASAYHHNIADSTVIKSLNPLLIREEIDAVIQGVARLPILASSKKRFEQLISCDEGSLNDATAVIHDDPSLALHVLRKANDEHSGQAEPATSIHLALSRLGLGAAHELLQTLETQPEPAADGLDYDGVAFWEHSVGTAILTADLAREAGGKPDDIGTAYTAGLIHDMGRLLLACRIGPRYAEVLETSQAMAVPLADCEAHLLLETHATLMDKVLRGWGCGPDLANPVGLHHTPPSESRHLAGNSIDLLNQLRLADGLIHAQLKGHAGDDTVIATDALAKNVGVDPSRLRIMMEKLPEQIDKRRRDAFPARSLSDRPSKVSRLLEDMPCPSRPIYAGLEPDTDAIHYLVQTLNPHGSTPNVIVAHVRSVRERSEVASKIHRVELDAGQGKLPLVVVSPKGNIQLDPAVGLGREIRSTKLPLHPEAFARLLDKLAASEPKAA
ncbi:MAG: HDOD domain-containing protein [Planctomycetota bacterium]